jgi:hypothetical protein
MPTEPKVVFFLAKNTNLSLSYQIISGIRLAKESGLFRLYKAGMRETDRTGGEPRPYRVSAERQNEWAVFPDQPYFTTIARFPSFGYLLLFI